MFQPLPIAIGLILILGTHLAAKRVSGKGLW